MLYAKIFGPIVGVIVVLFGVYLWGAGNGKKADAKRSGEIIAQKDELILDCQQKFAVADSLVTAQGNTINGLKDAADARERSAAAEIRAAKSEANVYRRKAQSLASAKPGPDQCESARELIVGTLSEDRP